MESFLTAIENHREVSSYIAAFIIIFLWSVNDIVKSAKNKDK